MRLADICSVDSRFVFVAVFFSFSSYFFCLGIGCTLTCMAFIYLFIYSGVFFVFLRWESHQFAFKVDFCSLSVQKFFFLNQPDALHAPFCLSGCLSLTRSHL